MRAFCLFLLLLGLSLYLVFETSAGVRLTYYALQYVLPGKLYVQELDGKLLSHLTLSHLRYQDDAIDINVEQLDVKWNGKNLFSDAIINYINNGLHWQTHIIANKVNLKYAGAILENISFNLETSGVYTNKINELHLRVNDISGEVNASPLSGLVDLSYHDSLIIKSIQLTLGAAHLSAKGYIDKKWDLTYKINIPKLAVLMPSIKGSIESLGTIKGLLNDPAIDSHTLLQHFTSDVATISQLHIDVNGKLLPPSAMQMAVKSDDVYITGYKIKSARANIQVKKLGDDLHAHLTHGQFSVPLVNASVNHIDINAILNNAMISWQGTLKMGNGSSTLRGETNLLPGAAYRTHLSLTGSELLIANLAHLNLVVSPTLQATYENNVFSTTGKIYIPTAKIVQLTHANVVSLPSDVVYTKNKNKSADVLKIANDVEVTLGNNIALNYENINTQVVGSLHLRQTPGSQLTATGTLSTKEGTYKAYGKELKIKVGKLIYVGNYILNPGLDVEAIHLIKQVGNSSADFITNNQVAVGIKVNGTLNQPHLTLISYPSMSQTNILSYLLFDTPASQLSVGNTVTLMNMAVSIKNGGNTPGTLSNIQHNIDNMGISIGSTQVYDPSSDTSQTTSTVGVSKKIGRKITVSYHTNPFNNLSVFGLHYQLSKYFVLRTQASNLETTTDIIFEIEKDD